MLADGDFFAFFVLSEGLEAASSSSEDTSVEELGEKGLVVDPSDSMRVDFF